MAYRRGHQASGMEKSGATWRPAPIDTTLRSSPVGGRVDFLEEVEIGGDDDDSSPSTSLAAKAIRASSAAHRESSLSSAYVINNRLPSPASIPSRTSLVKPSNQTSHKYSVEVVEETKQQQSFWGSLARKAKSFLEEDDSSDEAAASVANTQQFAQSNRSFKAPSNRTTELSQWKVDGPKLQTGLNVLTNSLNYIGNAVEGGLTMVENRTTGIIQETRKHIRKNSTDPQQLQGQTKIKPQLQANLELQLKASRDVAMAMAAKAKVLLRELKTVKADLAFAKERCTQLEEENRVIRENFERGGNLEDDEMIRLQLETLLSEKARLAHENSVYARENRFLREVVEYHQLTMQDVIYLDEGTEEVTEVYPIKVISNN